MASVASQLIEEVTAHAQSDSLENAWEISADGTYFTNNLSTSNTTGCPLPRGIKKIIVNLTCNMPWRHIGVVEVCLHSFFNLGAQCGGWSILRPRRLTPENGPVPIIQESGWVPLPVWTGAENPVPHQELTPGPSSSWRVAIQTTLAWTAIKEDNNCKT